MTRRQNWPGTDQVVPMSFRWSPAGNHNYTVALRHQSAKISDAIFEDCWIISEMYVPVSYRNCNRFLQQFFIKIRSKTNLFSIFPSYYEIWIHITDVQKQSFIKIIIWWHNMVCFSVFSICRETYFNYSASFCVCWIQKPNVALIFPAKTRALGEIKN